MAHDSSPGYPAFTPSNIIAAAEAAQTAVGLAELQQKYAPTATPKVCSTLLLHISALPLGLEGSKQTTLEITRGEVDTAELESCF